jgi:hypothetical protein
MDVFALVTTGGSKPAFNPNLPGYVYRIWRCSEAKGQA